MRELINAGRFSEAEVLLGRKAASERTAEWHFLYGHIMLHKGWMMEARQEFETACRMDPYNSEYQNTLVRMGQGASGDPYARSTHTSGLLRLRPVHGAAVCGLSLRLCLALPLSRREN